MRDPRRWRDDPSGQTPGTDILLRVARRPQPPAPHDMERLGAAVDVMSRYPVARPPSWLRLGLAGITAFAIVGAGTFVWALHARNAKREAAEAAARDARDAALEYKAAAARSTAPAPAPEERPVAPAPARSSRRHVVEAHAAAPAPAPTPAVAPTDLLAREVPLIDAARSEIASSPSRALASLEAHRREFPHGQLAAEREFLTVQALLQMNRMTDAKQRAAELASRYPSSSYAARAGRLIEEVEAQRAAAPARDGSRGTPIQPGAGSRESDRL
jgi:hypothetical protein